jgi:amino-acid N-acetyltransferase
MSATIRIARPEDRAPVLELLRAADLPLDGVAEHFESFFLAVDGERILGAAGLEFHGPHALLRSVVVAGAARSRGLGSLLTRRALDQAYARGAIDVYLLTTTAEAFFEGLGFERLARQEVPEPLHDSVEFRSACPASAVVMRRHRCAV